MLYSTRKSFAEEMVKASSGICNDSQEILSLENEHSKQYILLDLLLIQFV